MLFFHVVMHFLNLKDLREDHIVELILNAKKLKEGKQYSKDLKGKFLGLIFEKASTRTRISFEVAMAQLGGVASFLPIDQLQLGRGESLEDTSRVISSMTDGIVLRTLSHETIERFAAFSSVPVINGLSDLSHPCQILADLLTFEENNGEINGHKVAWIGDFNNVCYSYVEASSLLGFELHIASPKKFWPSDNARKKLEVTFTEDIDTAVNNSSLVTTDVWTSMGQEKEKKERERIFKEFRVTPKTMDLARKDAIFLHCLPAIRGQEISSDMLQDQRSKVWSQAQNRLFAQKSLLIYLLKDHKDL